MKETMNQTTDFDGPSPRKDDTWVIIPVPPLCHVVISVDTNSHWLLP